MLQKIRVGRLLLGFGLAWFLFAALACASLGGGRLGGLCAAGRRANLHGY